MNLPNPLVPANADLRNFPYMPLDVARLRDSDFTIRSSGEGFRTAVILWCASWHQVPAGSIPNDDLKIAHLAGFGRILPKNWKKLKEEALQGWILCSDDRYYHPVVCEKVLEGIDAKVKQQYERFTDRMRKANKKRAETNQPVIDIPEFGVWKLAGFPSDWANNSSGIPAESGQNSKNIPSNSALKGIEGNRRDKDKEIEAKSTQSASDVFSPDLEKLNDMLKSSGSQPIDQTKLDQTLVTFNPHYEQHELTENQRLARLVTWLKRDDLDQKPKQAKAQQGEDDHSDRTYFGILRSEVSSKALDHESEYDCAFRLNQEKNKHIDQVPDIPAKKARPAFTRNEDHEFNQLVTLNPDLTKLDIHERAELEGKPINDVLYAMKKELLQSQQEVSL